MELYRNTYVWLFPLLFIFHDMEEIIGLGPWYKKHEKMLSRRYPMLLGYFENYSTEGMALAVGEEFLLCIAVCMISIFTGWHGLWLGGLIAYTIHLVIHMGQAVVLRGYVPALATSIIALPLSLYLIRASIHLLGYSAGTVLLYGILGCAVVAANLWFAHILMHRFTLWLMK